MCLGDKVKTKSLQCVVIICLQTQVTQQALGTFELRVGSILFSISRLMIINICRNLLNKIFLSFWLAACCPVLVVAPEGDLNL